MPAEKIRGLRRCMAYLCACGPAFCRKCESACGYGKQFLRLAYEAGMTQEEIEEFGISVILEKERERAGSKKRRKDDDEKRSARDGCA